MFLCAETLGPCCATLGSERCLKSQHPASRDPSVRKMKGLPRMKKLIASLCLCLLSTGAANAASSKRDLQDRIDAAKTVLDQIMQAKDSTIPLNILEQATSVCVVPGLIKGAFVFGAQYRPG